MKGKATISFYGAKVFNVTLNKTTQTLSVSVRDSFHLAQGLLQNYPEKAVSFGILQLSENTFIAGYKYTDVFPQYYLLFT